MGRELEIRNRYLRYGITAKEVEAKAFIAGGEVMASEGGTPARFS